jgi:transcriptional regulator with XRE-family HTH domain
LPGSSVGTLFRTRRLELHLSREALAARAGVDSSTVRRVEFGQVNPHRQTLNALYRALRLSPGGITDPASKVVLVSITDLRAARTLVDPSLHPQRRDEAQRLSATLDSLLAAAEGAT